MVACSAQAKLLMATVLLAQVPGSARASAPASVLAMVLVLALALVPAWARV